jgi:hypothetical protein
VYNWTRFTETVEHGAMYGMRNGGMNIYNFVPKRAFQSASDETEFRRLVQLHTRATLSESAHDRP